MSCRLMALVGMVVVAVLPAADAGGPLAEDLAATAAAATVVGRVRPDPGHTAAIAAVQAEVARVGTDATAIAALRERLRSLRRSILFSHPGLGFDEMLVNVQCPPQYSHNCDQYLGRHSKIVSSADPTQRAAGLVVVGGWKSAQPTVRYLTRDSLPPGATRHPDLSYDARSVLFAYCDHTPKQPDERRFLIYEVPLSGGTPRQVTGTGPDAMAREDGRWTVLLEDFDPTYLPDGGFVFTSTRGQNFGRCHGGRYTPSFFLHRGELDGSAIRPLSFGEANEITPTVLNDGRIAYNRWDYINRHDCRFHKLWSIHPDGTGTANFWGNLTPDPLSVAEARAIPGSTRVMATATAHHSFTAGTILLIDTAKGDEGEAPLTHLTPEVPYPESHGYPASTYATPFPITEDLFLAAYSPRQHVHQGQVQVDDAYQICLVWHLDGKAYREPVFAQPRFSCFSPIPVAPRVRPPVLPSRIDPAAPATGTCYVQDVYQSTQPIPRGSVAYLRVNEILNQPAASHQSRGAVANENVKRTLGTVPVDADGGTAFRVPAGKRLQFQLLDRDHMAVMTMRTFMYLQPGEVVGCTGCHESRQHSPGTSAYAAQARRTVRDLTPLPGAIPRGGFSFAAQVQPILDRSCISCHGLDGPARAEPSLLGTMDRTQSIAYRSLTAHGLASMLARNQEPSFSTPREAFAARSRLPALLKAGHHGVALDDASWEVLMTWLDLNAQFAGDYSFNREAERVADPAGERALRTAIGERFGSALARQPFAALVNTAAPERSRVLLAPLAVDAGGWGQIAGGWPSTADPGYRAMLALVQGAIAPLPATDRDGTCNRPGHCVCGSCWVRQVEQAYRAALPPGAVARGTP